MDIQYTIHRVFLKLKINMTIYFITNPAIVKKSDDTLKLVRDVDGKVLIEARLDRETGRQWREIVLSF